MSDQEKPGKTTTAGGASSPIRVREAYVPKVDGVWVNGVRIDPKPKDLTDGE